MATAASPVIPPGFEIETPAPRAVRAAAPAIPEGFEIESAVSPGVQRAADDANAETLQPGLPHPDDVGTVTAAFANRVAPLLVAKQQQEQGQTISATPAPGFFGRLANAFTGPGSLYGNVQAQREGAQQPYDPNLPLVDFGANQKYLSEQGPMRGVTTGAQDFLSGWTTPKSIALILATGGLGSAGKLAQLSEPAAGRAAAVGARYMPIVQRLVSGGFSLDMIYGALKQSPQLIQQIRKGDTEGAAHTLTGMVATLGMGALAGYHAGRGAPEAVKQFRAQGPPVPEATANTVGAEPYRPGAQPAQPPAQPVVAKAPEPPQRTQAAAPPPKPRYSQGPPEPPKPEPAKPVAAQPAIPPGYEVETPAPKPQKPLHEMSAAELDDVIKGERESDQKTLVSLFGEDGAKRYAQLERKANSTSDPQGADAAQRELEQMEGLLRGPELDRLHGIGQPEAVDVEKARSIRNAIGRIDPGVRTPAELGDSLKYALSRFDPAKPTANPEAYAQLKRGAEIAAANGWDTAEVMAHAAHGVTGLYKNRPEDAAYILDSFRQPGAKAPPSQPAQPAQRAIAPPQPAAIAAAEPPRPGAAQRGEPGWVGNVPTSELHVDALRFQFKQNVGQGGAGEEFREVGRWDPEKAGVISVWRDPADGKDYVVNGHHRYEMATRLGAPEMTVRYLDAANAAEARLKGAEINIAEGRGEATDAAKIFRESGLTAEDLQRKGISLKGKIASEGLGVSKLAQPIYDDVMRGDLSTARGAIIGHGIEGKPDQVALYDALKKREAGGKRLTNSQLEEMIRLAKGAPKVTESGESAQVSMFGDQEFERSLLPEKAEISEYVRKQLGSERKLFGLVGDEGAAAKLGAAGNVIHAGENARIAEQAGRVQALYDKLSALSGGVDDALNAAAKRLADGENPNDVKREAYTRIRGALIEQSHKLTGVSGVDGEGAGGHAAGRISEVEPVRPGPEPPREPPPARQPSGAVSTPQETPVTPPAAAPVDDGRLFGESTSTPEGEQRAREEQGKLQAEQVNQEIKFGRGKSLDAGRESIEDSPLFGGPRQGAMFGDAEAEKPPEGREPRRGGISPELLTLGVTKFIEHDVKPTLRNAANAIADTYDDIRIAIAPHLRGGAKVSALFFRKHLGEMARSIDQAKYALRLNEKFFNAEPDKEKNFDFMDRMESGRKQATPELDVIAKTLRATFDDWRQQVQDLGTGKLKYYYENYFPHIWERNKLAKEIYGDVPEISGRGPLQGSKAFLKRRQIRTIAEGRKLGLEPKSDNPVTLTLMKIHEMAKYVMAHRMLKDWSGAGRAKLVPKGDDPPPGWFKIDPAIGSVYEEPAPAWAAGIREKPNREPIANWYAEAGSAQLLNNYLGPRLTRFAAFRAAMGLNNTLNLFNLGLSGFHLTKTAFEAGASRLAIGLEALERGRPITAAKHIAATPFAPFLSFLKGDRMMREWRRPGSQAATLGAIMDHLTSGGVRAGRDQMYRTEMGAGIRRALQQGNLPGALMRVPLAVMEAPTRWLMDGAVPRMKMGTMAEMAQFDLERLGPQASTQDVLRVMADTVNSVDNRMGEVARDNLFWNRYAADLGMFLMRADQYFLGTARELGGAAKDIVRQPLNALRGEPVNLKRMNYVASMIMLHTAASAIYQKLHTGQWPQEAKDYFYPKNGQVDDQGRPQRTGLWSYIKDAYSFVQHPLRTLRYRTAPVLSLISDLYKNAGFDRLEIRHPDDNPLQQTLATGQYIGKQFTPFSVQNYLKEGKLGASVESRVEQFFGINRAPADIDQSPAERLAREYSAARTPDEPRTAEAAERRELRQSLTRARRQKKPTPPEVVAAIRAGKFSKKDRDLAYSDAKISPLASAFRRLSIDEAERVYKAADAAEKLQLRKMLHDKAQAAMENAAPAVRAQMREDYRAATAAQ
jgi:hypothetical protein